MSDDLWGKHPKKPLTRFDMDRISERVARQEAKRKSEEAKAVKKAEEEAAKKQADDAQLTLF